MQRSIADAEFVWDSAHGITAFHLNDLPAGGHAWTRMRELLIGFQIKPLLDCYLRQGLWRKVAGGALVNVVKFVPFAFPDSWGSDGLIFRYRELRISERRLSAFESLRFLTRSNFLVIVITLSRGIYRRKSRRVSKTKTLQCKVVNSCFFGKHFRMSWGRTAFGPGPAPLALTSLLAAMPHCIASS
jgi:hypothetical protein